MISYIETIDRKETIQVAKNKMNKFSDLYKILASGSSIPSIRYDAFISSKGSINYTSLILSKIEQKDKRLLEIEKVLHALEKLPQEQAELLFMKHVQGYQTCKIKEILNASYSSLYRIMSDAYFNIAIALQIEVQKNE